MERCNLFRCFFIVEVYSVFFKSLSPGKKVLLKSLRSLQSAIHKLYAKKKEGLINENTTTVTIPYISDCSPDNSRDCLCN